MAAARDAVLQQAAQRAELLRSWGCKHADDAKGLLSTLEAALKRATPPGDSALTAGEAERLLCALPWAQGLAWADRNQWQAALECPECPPTECEPECDCQAPNQTPGRHNDHDCLVAYALARAYFTSNELPADVKACKASADEVNEAWNKLQRQRQKARDSARVDELRAGGPLDDSRWEKLAAAFAAVHYLDEPAASPSGETLRRSSVSLAQAGEVALSAEETAAVRAAFAAPASPEQLELKILGLTKPEGKVVLLCDWSQDGSTRREGVFLLRGGPPVAVFGPLEERNLGHPIIAMGNHQCDDLLDVVDIDGDGVPELVLRRYSGGDRGLHDWLEVSSLQSPARLRFKGMAHSQDTTQW